MWLASVVPLSARATHLRKGTKTVSQIPDKDNNKVSARGVTCPSPLQLKVQEQTSPLRIFARAYQTYQNLYSVSPDIFWPLLHGAQGCSPPYLPRESNLWFFNLRFSHGPYLLSVTRQFQKLTEYRQRTPLHHIIMHIGSNIFIQNPDSDVLVVRSLSGVEMYILTIDTQNRNARYQSRQNKQTN